MNAIISLCHFCEAHGPQVIFCTQPLHPLERTISTDSDDTVTDGRKAARSSSITNEPTTPTSAKNEFCRGCSSEKTGFISRDDDAQVNYISSKQPYDREVYSMSRQACLKSLTGEVCPGKDGPIFFGNDQQGHVLSYTFHINDTQARGSCTRYSILVVMMDKIYLLNSWPFLVPHLKTVIEHITKKANVVYEREKIKLPLQPPQASRVRSKPARSLIDLTDDRNIFKILHLSFVWILKACGNRITETLLEGPPTEDSIIDMEKQEETEEGFCLIFSKKVNIDEVEEESSNNETAESPETAEEEGPAITNIRHLMKILGEDKFHVLAHHVVIGNQIVVQSSMASIVRSVFNALKSLLPKGCCRVIPYSHQYEESWKCNFLGLVPEVELPLHIMSDESFVLVEISLEDQKPTDTQTKEEENDDLLKRLVFKMASPTTLPEKAPNALYKMELALQNEDLTDTVVEHYLICLKEEWMNKVKVRFKFTKAGGNRTAEDTKKLMQVIGAKEEDTPLLKFWMQGLSLQYRQHILTASKSSR